MTADLQCRSIYMVDLGDSVNPCYYRCVRTAGHGGFHRGHEIDELGFPALGGDEALWPDRRALNGDTAPEQCHPQDPHQIPFELETP